MLQQARKLLETVSPAPNAPASGPHWKSLHTLLKKAPCDQMRLARCVATRDVEAMQKLLEEVAVAPPRQPRRAYQPTQPAPAPAPAATAEGTPAADGDPARPAPVPASRPEIIIRSERPTPQQLKTALAAFKKRMKLTKLDQESRISGKSPLSSGAKSGIVAILPPNLYPRSYWEELEKQGQIRNTGGGFYELVEKAKPLRGAAAAAAAGITGSAPEVETTPDEEADLTEEAAAELPGETASSEEASPSA